jgi:arylformamidase
MTTGTNDQTAAGAPAVEIDAVAARRAANQARTAAVRGQFRHDLGISYGPHPRQVLDIYYPAQATAAPVLVFLHGGGFRNGEPAANGYNGSAVLNHGAIFVSMGYRLMPDAVFPDSCEDVELGLRWLRDHIAEHGGDPERIYLSGHSAGAMLASSVGLRSWIGAADLPSNLVKGLLLISGFYDHRARAADQINSASTYYVPNLLSAIDRVPEHTIVVYGDDDLPAAAPDAQAMVEAIKSRGGSVELLVEAGADHFAANKGLLSDDGDVFQATKRMMHLD